MPYGDTNNPLDNTNPPLFGGPNDAYNKIWELLLGQLGGPSGVSDTVAQVQGLANERMPFMERLPWSPEQINAWMTNQLTGKGAMERGAAFTKNLKQNTADRYATGYKELTGGLAREGMGKSSTAARAMAEGMKSYNTAQNANELTGQQYTDTLKEKAFNRGMTGLNVYENIARGDYGEALNQGNLLLNSLQPEMTIHGQDTQTLLNLLSSATTQQEMENIFNQWLYSQYQQGGAGGGDLGTIIGSLINAGGMYAAAGV